MAVVSVIRPGMQTMVQDLGRWGHQASGVPVAGAMDVRAHRIANALVGNAAHLATLEVTLIGPELEFDDARFVAVVGAEFDLSVDGRAAPPLSCLNVPAGGRLKFGSRRAGARAYVAVNGGFDVPQVLGSRSTHLPSGMGGFEGRSLKAGDQIPLGRAPDFKTPARPAMPDLGRATAGFIRSGAGPVILRVLPAPDLERFDDEAFDALMSGPYVLCPESNRMGFRLRGPQLRYRGPVNKLSEATPLGVIEVPPSGEPVLLMADRPTTGGYPAIANVITADIDLAAQLAPGDAASFMAYSVDEALDRMAERERELEAIEGER